MMPTPEHPPHFWSGAEEVRLATIERCAQVAAMFSIDKNSIHPDLTWEQMSERARMICHTTCQQVAAAIRALKDKP